MDSEEAVRRYKRLSEGERAIRSLKSVDLKVSPIHHSAEGRARAHSFPTLLETLSTLVRNTCGR